jgi:hypothetical protein
MSLSVDKTKTNWITYLVLGVIFFFLAVIALFVFQTAKEGAQEQAKADEFTAALTAAGLTAPSKDQIVRTLGTDGGAVCAADPGSGLLRASVNAHLTNGAAGPGQRPVIAPANAVEGIKIIIQVYCPENLDEFNEYVAGLKLDDVLKG